MPPSVTRSECIPSLQCLLFCPEKSSTLIYRCRPTMQMLLECFVRINLYFLHPNRCIQWNCIYSLWVRPAHEQYWSFTKLCSCVFSESATSGSKPEEYETVQYPLLGLVGTKADRRATAVHNAAYQDPSVKTLVSRPQSWTATSRTGWTELSSFHPIRRNLLLRVLTRTQFSPGSSFVSKLPTTPSFPTDGLRTSGSKIVAVPTITTLYPLKAHTMLSTLRLEVAINGANTMQVPSEARTVTWATMRRRPSIQSSSSIMPSLITSSGSGRAGRGSPPPEPYPLLMDTLAWLVRG